MKSTILLRTAVVLFLVRSSLSSIINQAKFIFAFGDSYTREGYSGQGSPLVPHAFTCSTAGPNWARQLVDVVNQVNRTGIDTTQLINLAISGATVNNSVVRGSAIDFVTQTTLFLQFLTQDKVAWTKDNAIFTVTFSTNDINNSFKNLTDNGEVLYQRDMDSYFALVEKLYGAGARQFLFNNGVPFDRAQTGIVLGRKLQDKLATSINTFNELLSRNADSWCRSKSDVKCSIFDTHDLVTRILDDFRGFGFATPDKLCASYDAFGGCTILPTVDPTCLGPVSAYVWKNALHPSWSTDGFWARSLFNQLSAIN